MEKLPGNYIAGFVDGEGCFALNFRKDIRRERKNSPVYFYWNAQFVIVLGDETKDKGLLEKIKFALGCGKITPNKQGHIRYSVQNIEELSKIIVPFFKKYKLYGRKKYDFALWKEAVSILTKNKQSKNKEDLSQQSGFGKIKWNQKDLNRLSKIKELMKNYKGGGKISKWYEERHKVS